ncbi:glycoside hydrolase family 25 protein [Paenibacillus peoriae]|uniref:glycoside hydrolase family 25 protein n=1 Tax=Paenibacillus peoriae TaxID=59893 RepID=UPI000760BDA4|nr:glycoside hydrolase family 25 protein [Paenibacillus peoriae]
MQNRNYWNVQGIDVSRHQGRINWSEVKTAGKEFALIKATQGKTYRDPKFLMNVRGARAVGVLIGAYHYFDATTENDARTEAQNLYIAIKDAGGVGFFDLPLVLDYETNPGSLSKTQISSIAKSFLIEIERLTGRQAMLYSGNLFAENFDASLGTYPLWIARYSSTPPWNVPAWSEWTIWQFSDSGTVPGINGNVDLNEYNGTLADLKAWWTKGKRCAEKDMAAIPVRPLDGKKYLLS